MKALAIALVASFAASSVAFAKHDDRKKDRPYTCYVTDGAGETYSARRSLVDNSKTRVQWRAFKNCRINSTVPETCAPQGCVKDEE